MITEELEVKLRALGSTALEMAVSLEALGVKGKRNHPACCPIARFLVEKCGVAEASVGGHNDISVWFEKDGPRFDLAGPNCVDEFVEDFDQGVYPALLDMSTDFTFDTSPQVHTFVRNFDNGRYGFLRT